MNTSLIGTAMTTPMSDDRLAGLRLWQLISPTLPVGAYAYSAGLEYAVEGGWIANEANASDWIGGQLENGLAYVDVPLMGRLYAAWDASDLDGARYWNAYLAASRETAELLAEDRHMGAALLKVLENLGACDPLRWLGPESVTFAAAFALAAVTWRIGTEAAAEGYLWAWLENQVAAAIKLVPLGQSAGQRMLFELAGRIPGVAERGLARGDDDIGYSAPGVAHASSRHETQYSRLFRS